MGKPIKNDFFSGNNGEVWVDGKKVITCHKASIVENIEYEEVPDPMNPGNTQRVEIGRNYDVTISYRPTGEEEFNAFLTEDDVSVIVSDKNIRKDKTKRYKAVGVTFDTNTLVNFERKKVEEIELTGKAVSVEKLQ